jgi:DNA invertase Pin-like site-specific DNA recombinase
MARVLARKRLSRRSDESTSLTRQEAEIEKWAKANGHEIIGWAEDVDFSRSIEPFKAPKLGPWLSDPVKVDQWDILLAWRVDRLGAGWKLSKLFAWIMENGKDLACTNMPFMLRDKNGWLTFTMYSTAAEDEWQSIQTRNAESYTHLKSVGRWPGGRYAYWLKPVPEGPGWTLELDPEPSRVMEGLIDGFLAGRPIQAMAEELTEKGTLTPTDYIRTRALAEDEARGREYRGKMPEGKRWHSNTITGLLQNPALVGWSRFGGSVVRNEAGEAVLAAKPLISTTRWAEIQSETAKRAADKAPRRERSAGPLFGILECARCAGPYHYNRQRRPDGKVYDYYRTRCGHNRMVRGEILETQVVWATALVLGSAPRTERIWIPAEDNSAELDDAEKVHADLSRLLEAAKSDRARARYTGQLEALDARMAELERHPYQPGRVEHRDTGETYGEALDRMTVPEVRDMLRDAGIRIEVSFVGEKLDIAIVPPDDLKARLGLDEDAPVFELAETLAKLQALPEEDVRRAVRAVNADKDQPRP